MDDRVRINNLARKLQNIDPSSYILQNPDKMDTETLKRVVKEYQFLHKLKSKLPEWAAVNHLLGADIKAIEQCSTPTTAQFKFKDLKVETTVDLTGGFGVDSYFLSLVSQKHTYNELNPKLKEIVAHNFKVLGRDNIECLNMSAEELVSNLKRKVDLIYIDPDRRGDQKVKLVSIQDCIPNLIELQDAIFDKTDELIIKYSPMLDHHLALTQLKYVYKVEIIAVKNDAKELVFYANKSKSKSGVLISAINFTDSEPEIFECSLSNKRKFEVEYSPVLEYLYEPNSAVMKSGLWSEIAEKYSVKKIAPNSHFFTSSVLKANFPGRILLVTNTMPFSKKIAKTLNGIKANIISRNFGQKPEVLRQKFKIKEGDNEFIIFTRDFSANRIVISTTKITT